MKKIRTENPLKAIYVFLDKECTYGASSIVIMKASNYDEPDVIYLQPEEATIVAEKLQEMVKKHKEWDTGLAAVQVNPDDE